SGTTTRANLPRGSGARSRRRRLGTGASGVLLRGSSLRLLARSQPLCTYVSSPSGRTSDTVTCRSTSGLDLTHSCRAPAPTTTVFDLSGALMYDSSLPSTHLYGGVAVH